MKTFIGGIGCFWDETKYDGIKGIYLQNVVTAEVMILMLLTKQFVVGIQVT